MINIPNEPDFSEISFLPGNIDFEKSNEALRFGYVLLFLYAHRLINEGTSDKFMFNTGDKKAALELLGANWRKNSDKDKNLSYPQLMHEVRTELNFFINGDRFPQTSSNNSHELHITDSEFLDNLAGVLKDLDGVTGFILAGNESCSDDLLNELKEYNYSYQLTEFPSTKIRALNTLKTRKQK